MTTTLNINIKQKTLTYPIYIGKNCLDDKSLWKSHIKGKQVMIITNNIVAPLYLSQLKNALLDFDVQHYILPDGEQHKTLTSWNKILNTLFEAHYHRDMTLIALGGGVTGDMTGFVAACYHRGVDFIQVPTTLLSQVDSSIGGKTAVNHPAGKNMIGAFFQPTAVFIDLNTLSTLPKRQFSAGLAEIIKAALLGDKIFFDWLLANKEGINIHNDIILTEMIERACKIKANIIMQDEKEQTGKRALLNLGHTFAHAIERTLGYGELLHGEAVAIGLVLAAKLSEKRGFLSTKEVSDIKAWLAFFNLPIELPPHINKIDLIDAMRLDKKIAKGKIHFVLLSQIGQANIVNDISIDELNLILAT